MKRCTYCGKEYPDDATSCAIDLQPLQPVISEPALLSVRERQHKLNNDHLKLLSVFHYTLGILTILFSSIFLLHVGLGVALALHPDAWSWGNGQPGPPALFGCFMAVFGGVFVFTGWTVGGLTIFSGRCMKHRKRWMFSAVMAGINCAFFPFGTALGAFTFAVLLRDSVRESYKQTV